MIDARHRWVFPEPLRLDPEVRAAARALGLGTFAATVLARRGIADPAAIARFLGAAEDGLNDPHLLPDADRLVERIRRARDGRRAGHGVRRLRCRRPDRARPARAGVPPPRPRRGAVRPVAALEEGHGLSTAAVEAAARDGVALIVTVDTGSTSVAEIADGRRPRDRRDHHRPPPPARGAPRGRRHRQPAARRLGLPGPRAVGVGRRVHRRAAAARRAGRRRGGGARPRGPRDDRDGVGRRAGRWARTGRSRSSGSSGCGRRRGPGSRRCSNGRRRARRGRPRDRRVRARAAAQRRRPGGGGARRRPAPARRHAGGGGRRWPRSSRRPTSPAAT